MDVAFFQPVSLILISSDSTFLGDLKITSSILSALSELAYLDFSLTYLYERDQYHQQSDVLCSIELLYEDH